MNACCPKCGAEYQLGDNLLGCKVECSVCHQKFIVGDLKRAPQNPVSLRCPKLLKFISILYIGLGAVIVLVSSSMCVDIAGNLHWFGGFWGVVAGVALAVGSYFFLVGRRLGRMFIAIGILLGVVSKSLIFPTLLCLPLGLSFSASAKRWFALCAEAPCTVWMQFIQNLVKLKLWTKLLLGALLVVYVLVFLGVSTALDEKGWGDLKVSPGFVSYIQKKTDWGRCMVILPLEAVGDGGIVAVGVNPKMSKIRIVKDGELLEEYEFDDGEGWKRCKEYLRTNLSCETARQVNRYLDTVRADL